MKLRSASGTQPRHSGSAVFEKYVPHCKEIELEAWRKRGLWHKLKDNAFYMLNEIL